MMLSLLKKFESCEILKNNEFRVDFWVVNWKTSTERVYLIKFSSKKETLEYVEDFNCSSHTSWNIFQCIIDTHSISCLAVDRFKI